MASGPLASSPMASPMKGIDVSYYYEGYSAFTTGEL